MKLKLKFLRFLVAFIFIVNIYLTSAHYIEVDASQTIWDFSYTGSVQNWTVPQTGTYKLEVWGGEGGRGGDNGQLGIKGAYNYITLSLTSGTTLSIIVGGKGSTGGPREYTSYCGFAKGGSGGAGGYPNGRNGSDGENYNSTNDPSCRQGYSGAGGGGGGGSSSISIIGGNGLVMAKGGDGGKGLDGMRSGGAGGEGGGIGGTPNIREGNGAVKITYLNAPPSLSLGTTTNTTLSEGGTATFSGTVNDPDGDAVTISATVNGKTKSTTVMGSGSWSLSWLGVELDEGTYSNIVITADDGKGGTASVTYTGTITVDKTKPTITVSPTQRSTWDTSIVNIAISLADNLSGIANRNYQLTSSPTPTGSWQTAASNSFNVSVNTEGEWYLHVSAADAAGNQIDATYGPYRYFNLEAPSNIRFTDVSTTSLKLEWDTQSGHEYFVELQDKNNNIVKSTGWITSGEYTFTDLTPNALYKPFVKSRKHGKESTNQLGPQQYTDAVPVTSAIFEPLDKAIKITLNIDETGNDPDTEYIIKNLQTGQESPPVKKEWINDQLMNDMEYQYAAKVIHKNGKEGEWKLIGVGQTIATKIEPPIGWEDPVGGLDPIDLDNGEFDPDTIDGKVVWFNGKKAIVVKGRILHIMANNVKNAKQYSISLTGFGYSDWKDLDETGSFSESIFLNEPGFYEVHLKFKNAYGRESQPFVRNYLVDWVNPEVSTTPKIKGQTATTNGSFSVNATGIDNLSQIMYYNGSSWRKFTNNQEITLSVPLNNQRNTVVYKFSDLNGNVVQSEHQVWGINK